MAIYGHIWPYISAYAHIWVYIYDLYMTIYEHVLTCQAIDVHIWPYVTIYMAMYGLREARRSRSSMGAHQPPRLSSRWPVQEVVAMVWAMAFA